MMQQTVSSEAWTLMMSRSGQKQQTKDSPHG
jgi:hypothetical protein